MIHPPVAGFVSFQKYLAVRNTNLTDAKIKNHTPLPDIGSEGFCFAGDGGKIHLWSDNYLSVCKDLQG